VTEDGQGRRGSYAAELAVALEMASRADELTLRRFQALDLVVQTKPDLTPVTDADTSAEELLRAALANSYPLDAVVGEEMGGDAPDASWTGRRWVLDPIDGTKNFVRGVPVWATLIALVDGPQVVVGVVSAPALGRRWWASAGSGAWAGGALVGAPRRIGVSDVAAVADASLSYSDVAGWADGGHRFRDLAGRCWRTRAFGDFWSHLLVAEGAVDIAVEPELSVWDVAALIPLVHEAGGRITGCDGGPALHGSGAVTTNGRLHEEVLGVLGSAAAAGAAG
jgi:histidinol-phosphatase